MPHKFAQDLPGDVDFHVMLTFLDFYHVFLRFVLDRLSSAAGMPSPPSIDALTAEIDALTADTEESRELLRK